MGSRNYAGKVSRPWPGHLTSSVKRERGVDFRFSQGCEQAAEEDLRLARDPGTDDEGRSTTVT
ncbi:hypothetical protein VAWG006_12120 [Aeromonas enteropelogenes]|nr:hypothetical protein VAWG006_12120 [Aeromonas enteropelogenes]BEE21123.1 hypothetical protein VAWG007_12180 [Aeromonas enteropelogenes]